MQRQVKLRYANEFAGAFVLLTTALFIAAIVLTGKSQRWLEGNFRVYTSFATGEGAFGLQEGNDIKVRNTVAGRVARIEPTQDGKMTATLVIKDSFRQFIYRNSIGHISTKMHGVGASYIEIVPPPEGDRDELIHDDDYLTCVKDEELIDQATKLMTQVEEIVLPMTRDLALISRSISEGRGLVGALVMDQELAEGIQGALGQTDAMVAEVRELIHQSTRTIRAAQKSFLLRKHMDDEAQGDFVTLSVVPDSDYEDTTRAYSRALEKARLTDDPQGIIESAHNLAVYRLEHGEYDRVAELLSEIRQAAGPEGGKNPRAMLLEAEMARRRGEKDRADMLAADAIENAPRGARDVQLLGWIVLAENYCDTSDPEEALSAAKKVASLKKSAESPALRAMAFRALGRTAALVGDWEEAAGHFDAEAASLRTARLYAAMATALAAAGDASEHAGHTYAAADRFYRAGRTLYYRGDAEGAAAVLKRAAKAAEECGNEFLVARIGEMMGEAGEEAEHRASNTEHPTSN